MDFAGCRYEQGVRFVRIIHISMYFRPESCGVILVIDGTCNTQCNFEQKYERKVGIIVRNWYNVQF